MDSHVLGWGLPLYYIYSRSLYTTNGGLKGCDEGCLVSERGKRLAELQYDCAWAALENGIIID